jgi:adhesin/invasin
MVTRSLRLAFSAVFAATLAFAIAACDKMPLVAPTGTVITLFANNTVLPVDGSIDITAIAIAGGAQPSTGGGTGGTGGTTTGGSATPGQGTPVHNGTRISFTTTLGRVEPQEAETHNGQVTVKLFANGASGVATVRAFSGGAASNELTINVGAAAAKTVVVSASPQTLNSSGGSSTISARVLNASGSALSGVPVTFTADNGTLSSSTALTDSGGVASVTLTTSRETKVTATVSGDVKADVTVKVNPRIGLTITPPTTTPTAGLASTFQIAVASTSNVQSLHVDWDDGTSTDLGAVSGTVSVSHTYTNEGNYTVAATATDASGDRATVSTGVQVLPQQPPSVTVTSSNNSPHIGEIVTLTASVSGASSTVQSYQWDLGSCSNPPSPVTITSTRLTVSWGPPAATCVGTKVITVTVTQSSGPAGIGQTAVNVIQ